MSFYNVNALNNLLKLWEDHNYLASIKNTFLQYIKKQTKFRTDEINFPFIGSELNSAGELDNSITDYHMLRQTMEGKKYFHPTGFLPRIPKDARTYYKSSSEFIQSIGNSSLHIPEFLTQWNKTRRACIVDDSIPIPLVDLREENWFDKMPYDSFYLKIASPLVFTDQLYKKETSIQNFLIHEEGEYIKIMAWNEDVAQWLLSSDTKKDIKKHLDEAIRAKDPMKFLEYAKHEKKSPPQVYHTIIKKNTTRCKMGVLGNITEVVQGKDLGDMDFYTTPQHVSETIPYHERIKLLELINGFCKLMATLPPQIHNEVEIIETKNFKPQPEEHRIWTDLPLQYVQLFTTELSNKIITIRRSAGTEKDFHWRRGHMRRYLQPDGSIKEVWVARMKIRPDKEEEQGLPKGGATKIKET